MPKIVDHDERRAHYLAALWRIVDRDGVSAVTTRSVAAEAGMSKSNIAHYFASQNDLVAAAVAQQVDEVGAKLDALDLTHCTPEIAVRAILLAIPTTPARRRQSQVWLWLVSRGAADPDLKRTLIGLNAQVREGVDMVLTAMAANGLIGEGRDLDIETDRLHALVDGLSLQTLSDRSLMPTAAIRRIVTDHVTELAQPRPD